MRDKIMNDKYFENYIIEDTKRIIKFLEKLENKEDREDRILPLKPKIHDLKLGILIAKYSEGDSLQKLQKDFLKLIDTWKEVWEPDYYNKNLKMISLAILFNVKKII